MTLPWFWAIIGFILAWLPFVFIAILYHIEALKVWAVFLLIFALAPSLFILGLSLILEGMRAHKQEIQEENRRALMTWLETKGFHFPDQPRCKGAA